MIIVKSLAVMVAGMILGAEAMLGIVITATAPPEINPASQPIITYG